MLYNTYAIFQVKGTPDKKETAFTVLGEYKGSWLNYTY